MNLLLYITTVLKFISSFFVNKKPCLQIIKEQSITLNDMIEKRLQKFQNQYVDSFSITNIDWDENSSDTGDIWKSRILCEYTHSGNVSIVYDSTFQGFYYYSDSTVQNRYLMLLIMKYVLLFRCRKFCISSCSIELQERELEKKTTTTITTPITPALLTNIREKRSEENVKIDKSMLSLENIDTRRRKQRTDDSLPVHVESKLRKNVIVPTPVTSIKYCGTLRDIITLPKKINTNHKEISYAMFTKHQLLAAKEKEVREKLKLYQ